MKLPAWMIRVSVGINEHTGGRKGYSLCAQLYANRLETSTPSSKFWVTAIDRIFWFDPEHCRKAWLCRNK